MERWHAAQRRLEWYVARLRLIKGVARLYRNWPTVIYSAMLPARAPTRDVDYVLRSGVVLHATSAFTDLYILSEVWRDKIYEQIPEFIVQDGWIVIDVGAQKGTFSVRSALSGTSTPVHAVEPEPNNARYLRENVTDNGLVNVFVHEAAVWIEAGCGRLSLITPGEHSLTPTAERQFSAVGEVLVRTVTLDTLLREIEHIDLLKMDIEGSEYPVLGSVSSDTLSRIQRIVMEYHSQPGFSAQEGLQRLLAILRPSGFRCATRGERMLYAIRRDVDAQAWQRVGRE